MFEITIRLHDEEDVVTHAEMIRLIIMELIEG